MLKRWKFAFVAVVGLAGLALVCGSVVSADGDDKSKGGGGAELWANNCRQCHNYRKPRSYSTDQWEIAVTHMRYRCGLTSKEAKKIIEFLKSAH